MATKAWMLSPRSINWPWPEVVVEKALVFQIKRSVGALLAEQDHRDACTVSDGNLVEDIGVVTMQDGDAEIR
jgi:hypothetical protein